MLHITEISESDTQTSYPVTSVVWSGKTAFCDSVVFADSPTYGRMLFLDGELQSAAADEAIYHESLVHPVMASHSSVASDSPSKRVLVVGGGEGATVREVLKWSTVSEVIWVDIDVELVKMCREYLRWAPAVYDDPRVRFIGKDIREVLDGLGTFDVIILDLPDPDGDTEYLYSDSFWKDLATALRMDGRIVTHVGPVRPFGPIGLGLERVWDSAQAARFEPWIWGFYSTVIPSFQGSWGFWITGPPSRHMNELPFGLSVVDEEQLRQWQSPTLVWRTALDGLREKGVAVGRCGPFDR